MVSQISVGLPASRALLSSTSPILFHPSTFEPFLPLPSASSASSRTFILTPPRLSDVPSRVTLLNDPTVSPFVFSPPNPYLPAHAVARTKDALEDADGVMKTWIETGKLEGCPFQVLREVVGGEEEDRFVGELGVHRESSFMEVPEGPERDLAIVTNQDREAGDPEIVWTMFFLLLPAYAGKGLMSKVLADLFVTFLAPAQLLNVRHVLSYSFVGNAGSKRVHEKLGFKLIGTDWIRIREDRGGEMREEWIFEYRR